MSGLVDEMVVKSAPASSTEGGVDAPMGTQSLHSQEEGSAVDAEEGALAEGDDTIEDVLASQASGRE